jgi:acyl-CoA thioesterase I
MRADVVARPDLFNATRFVFSRHTLLVILGLLMASISPSVANAKNVRIVAFGDSLSAGYQLAASEAFPAQLERRLRARGHAVEVHNAGVSGDTTATALDRLEWAVPADADIVIVEFGANDALRGLDPKLARANLEKIVQSLKARGHTIVLAGMAAPRNLGAEYVAQFDSIYPDLARAHDLVLYPFFLDGVILNAALNLADGMHPNAQGVGVIADRILPTVETAIARLAGRAANRG